MRIVFAGTPDFAATHLQALLDYAQSHTDFHIVGVYSQPDRPANRGKKLMASPVKQLALENGLDVYQPLNFKADEDVDALAALKPDLMVVVAYGLLLPQRVLDIPTLGCINSHASLLPRWRGAAPIERAIEMGDSKTGVTVMQMEAGLDTGPMLYKAEVPIAATDTGGSMRTRLATVGAKSVIEVVERFSKGPVLGGVQDDSLSSYAKKLNKQEALINWHASAEAIALKVRAFNPAPMCFTLLGDQRIRVLQAEVVPQSHRSIPGTILSVSEQGILVACSEFSLNLKHIQLPNKKPAQVADILNGNHPFVEQYVLASEF